MIFKRSIEDKLTSTGLINEKTVIKRLENQKELQDIEDRSRILNMLLQREVSENSLREKFSNKLFWLLTAQIVFVNLIIMGVGAGYFSFYSDTYVKWLFIFGIAESGAFITVIVKYLFKNDRTETSRKIDIFIDNVFKRENSNRNNISFLNPYDEEDYDLVEEVNK